MTAEKRTLRTIFSKYIPELTVERDIFTNAGDVTLTGDREKKTYRVFFSLPFIAEKKDLYSLEEKLCTLYQLRELRLLPKYSQALFSQDYLPQVYSEAKRVGAVTNGFFDNCQSTISGNTLTIAVHYRTGGVELLDAGNADEIVRDILKREFSLDFEVEIKQSDDYEMYYNEYLEKQAKEILAMQESAEAQRAAWAEQEAQRREKQEAKPEETLNLKRVASIFGGECAAEQTGEGIFRCGRMSFDVTGAELVYGDEDFDVTDPTVLRLLNTSMRSCTVLGTVFQVRESELRGTSDLAISIGVTDGDSSAYLKLIMPPEKAQELQEAVKTGDAVAAEGGLRRDKQGDYNISLRALKKIKRVQRTDNAPVKRVELHLHTNLSATDAIEKPEDAVKAAKRFGHRALAITDHGSAQGFPTAMLAAEKADGLKILYGTEAYFVDDTARALYGDSTTGFDDEIVVFDIETTGLSPYSCKITEIGAVLVCGGEIISRFNTFVDPECHIPENITELTGIDDTMVAGAPKIAEALPAFLEFAGGRLLVAHNAGFDTSFIRFAADSLRIPFENPYLDTVAMSRYVNPELKKHKLDSLAEYFGLGDFNHHRASDDAEMLSLIFFRMTDKLRDEGVNDFAQMTAAMSERADPLKLRTYHQIIIAKNLTGLKNLYKLISESYLTYYKRHPRIPKTRLQELREGLIIGSACEAGEVFRAVLENKSQAEIDEIASFYDYLEIQPVSNNSFLVENGTVADEEGLRELNRKIVALGERLHKPVCATCDVHYLEPEDEIYRRILLAGMKYADADKMTSLYYRTTEEMLREFSYLGEEKAYEVVVTNTNLIADMTDKIRPIPEGSYPPNIEGSEEELTRKCHDTAREMYGDPLPLQVSQRLERELDSIIKNGFAVMYIIARRLVDNSERQGYQVGSRGSVGSSFAAAMAGITRVNSLPPHYRCPKCRYSEWHDGGDVKSGFDLPKKSCPECGFESMIRDGHDIPFETFLGFYGDKTPDIDLNFSGDVQGDAHRYTEVLFGQGHAFRAGTIGTLAEKTAYGYVAKYLEGKGISVCRAETERLISGCVGVKRTTGQHPGGIIVVPKDYEIYDFCPVQHPADDPNSDTVTTHFEFKYLHDTILKLDILGHDIPTKYKRLEEYTGTNVLDCDLSDPALYRLFTSPDPLGVTKEELGGVETGTLGLPEMNTKFVRGVLIQANPRTFSDLLQISGLTHGTGVWLGNADELIKSGVCTIADVIGCRDDIMLCLIHKYKMDKALSFKITEDVRKGRGLKPEYEEAMVAAGVPDWYIDSCKKIKYMFPKAHAAAYVIDALRLGWYKLYYPAEFYAAYFTAAPGGVEAETVAGGRGAVKARMKEIADMGKEATAKDNEIAGAMQLVNEALARGVRFLPVDLKSSHATKFLPEGGGVRLPFCSIGGLGETAAENIMRARDNEDIFSVEDLKSAAKLSKSVIEVLDKNGVLSGMSETNQLTMF